MINVDEKISQIASYMRANTEGLRRDVYCSLGELNIKRQSIEEQYDALKAKAIEDSNKEKENLQNLHRQATNLVEGIRRKLFKKQQDNVTSFYDDSSDDPKYVLSNLEREIKKFEKSSLPYGLRQFLDSVSLMFNSNYGQAEVEKIVSLYNSIEHILESNELDRKLGTDLSSLERQKMQEIYSIDNKKNQIVNEAVRWYIYDLKKLIFNV